MALTADQIKGVKKEGFLQNRGTENFSGRIITINGKITAEQNAAISEAAAKFGNGNITLTSRQTIEVQGIPFDQIKAFQDYIAKAGLVTGGTGSKVRPVVSCKGTTCQYGLQDTFALSEAIHHEFYTNWHSVLLPHKFKIAVGGCPNNCVKPDLNDLGVIGQLVPEIDEDMCNGCKKCTVTASCPMHAMSINEDGVISVDRSICNDCGRCVNTCNFDAVSAGKRGFRIYIGGRWGKKVNHGIMLNHLFESQEEVMKTIEKAILFYREQGITGERFADTIERLGFEYSEQQILSDDILDRKQQILDAQLHLVGGATC